MTPILPDCPSWSSAIGNIIINFGMLDLLVQDSLEATLPPEEFSKIKERPFYDRMERLKKQVDERDYPAKKKVEFEQFFLRFEPIRQLRNHIAHGISRIGLGPDQKTLIMTLSLPRDLDGAGSPDARHLTWEELLAAMKSVTERIEDFQKLFGNWVLDLDVRF